MAYDRTKEGIDREAQAAVILVRELSDGDEDLNHDLIEGETSFFEAIEVALSEIEECEILATGLNAHIDKLQTRLKRIDGRAGKLRGIIDQAFQMAEVKTHVFDRATITTKSVPPKLVVLEEAEIPSDYFTPQPPKMDRASLLKDLKAGKTIPGASLSNGGQTIQIRRS